MGRSLISVLAVVGLVVGLGLIDRNREPEPPAPSIASGSNPPPAASDGTSDASGSLGLGDTSYLVSCLGSALSEAGDVPPSPPLSSRGVEEIAKRIERLRELRFDGPLDVAFLADEGIDRRISELVDRDYPARLADRQTTVLELLGAIPPGSDLLELTQTVLASQVVGLFVPETEELLVSSSGEAGALEEITLAHELQHALAFDALGLPIPERTRAGRSDRDLAALALIEGDATLTMELYALRYVELSEQLSLLDDPAATVGEEELEALPHILQRRLLFPYEAGLEFVCSRYERGGWEAVDRAYDDPPASTAELLDPLAGPVRTGEPPEPGSPGPPWRRTLADQLGAAELSWLFEAPGGRTAVALPDPEGAAADWRGGRFELWQDGEAAALGISLAERPGGDLCGAVISWYGASFPDAALSQGGEAAALFEEPGQSAAIACAPEAVTLGIGPDPATASSLSG